MSHQTDRRTFMKSWLAAPAAAALTLNAHRHAAAQETGATPAGAAPTPAGAAPTPAGAAPTPAGGALPEGRIVDLHVSRLLLGGNLLTHYTHSRDLKYVYNLAAHYNTDDKILDTLAVAEQNGINTLVVHVVPSIINVLKKYRRERGGKIQWIICPTAPVEGRLKEYEDQVKQLVDDGVDALYLWGVQADHLVSEGSAGMMATVLGMMKEHGKPCGVGAHDIKVIAACEDNKVGADFYIKTLHHHNYPSGPKPNDLAGPVSEIPGYWCRDPQEVINYMKGVEKPWIAFKVMAAGAIPPQDAFHYAFTNGADHVLAGMFDFEIAEDAALIRDVLPKVTRTRPWRT